MAARLFLDPTLVDQGLLSRILVLTPDTKQGQRFWRDADPDDEVVVRAYVARLNELFRRPMPIKEGTRNELEPRALLLTDEARSLWIAFSDEMEGQLRPGGDLEPIFGFAAKLAEHAARIAGVLTLYDAPDAVEIGAAALSSGIALSRHYGAAALRLHGSSRVNAELVEATKLLDWMQSKWSGDSLISLPDIVQLGPNATRDTTTARRLVAILEQHRHLERQRGPGTINGKRRREVWRIVGVPHA